MKYESILFSIDSVTQLDGIKKPLISFYSPKKTVQSVLALEEVKRDLRPLLRQGKRIEIRRLGGEFNFRVYEGEEDYIALESRGIRMLERGLDEMRYTHPDYRLLLLPPVIGGILGLVLGSLYGHYSQVWAGGTAGAIEKAEIIESLKYGLFGLGAGAVVSAIGAGAETIKDVLEEPIRRINLAGKLQKIE